MAQKYCSIQSIRVSVGVSLVVKKHHDHSNLFKGKIFNWGDLYFNISVDYHHGATW